MRTDATQSLLRQFPFSFVVKRLNEMSNQLSTSFCAGTCPVGCRGRPEGPNQLTKGVFLSCLFRVRLQEVVQAENKGKASEDFTDAPRADRSDQVAEAV